MALIAQIALGVFIGQFAFTWVIAVMSDDG